MAWMGMTKDVFHYLDLAGADRDPNDGSYLIGGKPVVAGIGDEELIIHEETVYFVKGQRVALAEAMASTSYGLTVKVF